MRWRCTPILALVLLGGCIPKKKEKVPVAPPTAQEAEVLKLTASVLKGGPGVCITGATYPVEDHWMCVYSLSFPDQRGLTPADDPRFVAVADRRQAARPEQRLQTPTSTDLARRGFRILDDAESRDDCKELYRLYQPLFEGDLALVYSDWRSAALAGGWMTLHIYRHKGGRWSHFATGSESFGRPII